MRSISRSHNNNLTLEDVDGLLSLTSKELESRYQGEITPEAVRMILAIQRGSKMGAGEGWFGPAESRYSWDWLARRHGINANQSISAEKFLGPRDWFVQLDRNRDEQITAEDLDWSEENAWVKQAYIINRLFRRIDHSGTGLLSRDNWLNFFDKHVGGAGNMEFEDLRDAILSGGHDMFHQGDAPSREALIEGLRTGELGSPCEGPNVNDPAPDFCLMTYDGEQSIRLSELLGTKPVVLVFGNFTCPPFRSMAPGADAVYGRFGNSAHFLCVYVREAHPIDGWRMASNDNVGIEVSQPTSYKSRVSNARRCQASLRTTMPLLVDEMDDSTGHAYSGMPDRLYVIDRTGNVAYKSGRGPFGFRVSEMEQALVMALLEQALE
ncbi:MAG: deiodinase family protein [Planctomycetaceae bacterium]|nr:deiodinase family protein [Planctomycetaceae bacterium]MCB9953612.1 redoxin domain-containing protein [Planctomycetaceae bacterium]